MSATLETVALGKRFRGTWALRDCSLQVPEQTVVGLTGPNGAGKSTLLSIRYGRLAPHEVVRRNPRDGLVDMLKPWFRGVGF